MIFAPGSPLLKALRTGRSSAILNIAIAPTGELLSDKNMLLSEDPLRTAIVDAFDNGPEFDLLV